ncbi:hypothetical protein OIU84_023053 [Salix udensis]|uniref:Uncharacterized protein n=1 Tax=Salix udensis TaxID=889485 RepID=A0AAD6PFX0_9ROSI|nr:hypothetical protein OIU84_023053 [Salix udensis]
MGLVAQRLTSLYRSMVAGLNTTRNIAVHVLVLKWYIDTGKSSRRNYKGGDDPTFVWVVCLVKGVADGIKGKHSKGLGRAALLASSDWVCLVDHWDRLGLHFT